MAGWNGRLLLSLTTHTDDVYTYIYMHVWLQAAAVLASLDPSTTKRRARILTHQVASLTLLGYTASLSAHKVWTGTCAVFVCVFV